VAYLMSCMNVATDGARTSEANQVRLFPSSPEHRWQRRVHEQILGSLRSTGCTPRHTGITVHHVGYQDHAFFLRKVERNLRLLEAEYANRPRDGWYFSERGGAFFELRRFAEAVVDLEIAAGLAPKDARPRVFSLLAEAYLHLDGPGTALQAVRRGLEEVPGGQELLLLEGSILAALGELGAAEATLRFALDLPSTPDLFELVDATLPLRMRHMLARVHLLQGRPEQAENQARTILRDRPAFGPAVLTVGEALLLRGDAAAFEELVRSIPDDPEAPTGRAVLWAMKALADGDPELALGIVADGIERDPQSAFLQRVRVQALLAAGKAEAQAAAQAAVEDRRRNDPLDLGAAMGPSLIQRPQGGPDPRITW